MFSGGQDVLRQVNPRFTTDHRMRSHWPFPGLLSAGVLLTALAATSGIPSMPPAGAATPVGRNRDSPAAAPAQSSGPDAGMVTIESDSQQADNRTGVITATGNVRISYPDGRTVATARQAQYYSREGRLILSGDVDVVDADGQRIRAERLVYRLDSERLMAEPVKGGQVTSRLRLQSRQAPAGAAAPAPALMP
jgi:lipopolysaccharide export system protein LptA